MLRMILNVIWLVFCGLWMAVAYVVAGLVAFILIITIPFGIASFRIAGYVLWILLFGWWLALGHLVSGVMLALTIIGIPLAAGSFKIIPITLVPLGVRIVPADRAYADAA